VELYPFSPYTALWQAQATTSLSITTKSTQQKQTQPTHLTIPHLYCSAQCSLDCGRYLDRTRHAGGVVSSSTLHRGTLGNVCNTNTALSGQLLSVNVTHSLTVLSLPCPSKDQQSDSHNHCWSSDQTLRSEIYVMAVLGLGACPLW
jgi:hypothetical protein